MIDFHTHTLLSDGDLGPAEHIRRAEMSGYRILGFSDHSDLSTMDNQISVALAAARKENELGGMLVLVGTELTHVRPSHIPEAVKKARALGAQYVIVHGETIVEPVPPGTNRAAIEAGADILAHPGLITEDDARLAAKRGVLLEISAKNGHSLTNGHVAKMAMLTGACLIFGSDAHTVGQMPTRAHAERICHGAGLEEETVREMFTRAEALGKERAKRHSRRSLRVKR